MQPDYTSATLARLLEQQRRVMSQCQCGAAGTVYAADERTPLCGKHWLEIYGEEDSDD